MGCQYRPYKLNLYQNTHCLYALCGSNHMIKFYFWLGNASQISVADSTMTTNGKAACFACLDMSTSPNKWNVAMRFGKFQLELSFNSSKNYGCSFVRIVGFDKSRSSIEIHQSWKNESNFAANAVKSIMRNHNCIFSNHHFLNKIGLL